MTEEKIESILAGLRVFVNRMKTDPSLECEDSEIAYALLECAAAMHPDRHWDMFCDAALMEVLSRKRHALKAV